MTGAESLDSVLEIIIGGMAFLFGRLCLRHPIGHTVRDSDSRHDLSTLFRRILIFPLYDADIRTDQWVDILLEFAFLLVT